MDEWGKLSVPDKILFCLLFSRHREGDVAFDNYITQDVLAKEIGVRRSHVSTSCSALIARKLIEERTVHIRGGVRRKKAYFLTRGGYDKASIIRDSIFSKTIAVVEDKVRSQMIFRDAYGKYSEKDTVCSLLNMVSEEGELDVRELNKKRTEEQKELQPTIVYDMMDFDEKLLSPSPPSIPPSNLKIEEKTSPENLTTADPEYLTIADNKNTDSPAVVGTDHTSAWGKGAVIYPVIGGMGVIFVSIFLFFNTLTYSYFPNFCSFFIFFIFMIVLGAVTMGVGIWKRDRLQRSERVFMALICSLAIMLAIIYNFQKLFLRTGTYDMDVFIILLILSIFCVVLYFGKMIPQDYRSSCCVFVGSFLIIYSIAAVLDIPPLSKYSHLAPYYFMFGFFLVFFSTFIKKMTKLDMWSSVSTSVGAFLIVFFYQTFGTWHSFPTIKTSAIIMWFVFALVLLWASIYKNNEKIWFFTALKHHFTFFFGTLFATFAIFLGLMGKPPELLIEGLISLMFFMYGISVSKEDSIKSKMTILVMVFIEYYTVLAFIIF